MKSLHRLWSEELLVVNGDTRAEILEAADAIRSRIREDAELRLSTLAAELAQPLTQPRRPPLAIVAASIDDLDRKLAHVIERLGDPECLRIKERSGVYFLERPLSTDMQVAFMFPGEGAQYRGMLADVCMHFPAARHWFDVADAVLERRGVTTRLADVLFGPDSSPETLWSMDIGAAAVFASNQALLAVARELGIHPDAVVGHSTGDYSALYASGALVASDETAIVNASCALGDIYEQLHAGGEIDQVGLIAVAAPDQETISRLLHSGGAINLALDNCPNQVVLAATAEAVDRTVRLLTEEGAVCTVLPFGRAYHTRAFRSFADALEPFVARLDLREPDVPLWSCATASPYPPDLDQMRRLLIAQWTMPVRFRETVKAMYRAGVNIFVELGPRGSLTSFVSDTLRKRPHLACAANIQSRTGLTQLAHLAGLLLSHGVPVAVHRLFPDVASSDNSGSPQLPLNLPRLTPPAPPRTATTPRSPAPLAATPTTGSTSVLEEYFRTMEQFVTTQEAVMADYLASAPQRELIREWQLRVETDPFLRDHAFGRDLSRHDPNLLGLPVVPLTFSIEFLAQAAAALEPGRVPVSLRNVRAHRWITLDDGEATLRVHAEQAAVDEVAAWIEYEGTSAIEATIDFSDRYPPPPPATLAPSGQRSRWLPERLYAEGMFHGPSLRGVMSVDTWAPNAVSGTLQALPTDQLGMVPLTDPILLDSAGQLIGFWSAEHEPLDVFPFAVAQIELFGPALPAGRQATCVAQIEPHDRALVSSDLEIVAGEQLHARITGWDDRRFALPKELVALRADPASAGLGITWPPGCMLINSFSDALLNSGGGIWRSVLAHLLLGEEERREWRRLSPNTRDAWLRGRAAAKEAVRVLSAEPVPPAEIRIANDESGRPYLPDDPGTIVSIAHCGEVAVAIASREVRGVGIDAELSRPLSSDVIAVSFDESERALLDPDWLLRGWCAKEAVAKAHALQTTPLHFRIVAANADTGEMAVQHPEEEEVISVTTAERDGIVSAACVRTTTQGGGDDRDG